ncbi:hypothetical protein N9H19_00830 [Flavobacteriales bacterium]|nr:hypothetical protein [Flavobacteriales bacterium]
MTTIISIDDSFFQINDYLRPRVYRVDESNGKVKLTGAFKDHEFIEGIEIDTLSVDGQVLADFANKSLFLNELQKIVFKKGGGDGTGSQTAQEIVDAVYVDQAAAIAGGLVTGQYYHTGDFVTRIIS